MPTAQPPSRAAVIRSALRRCQTTQTIARAGRSSASFQSVPRPRVPFSPTFGHLYCLSGRKPSLSPVTHWKLPPQDAGDDGTRVGFENLNFIPVIIDHEVDVRRYTHRRNLGRVSTGAITIHCICADFGRRDYVAVLAYNSSRP